MNRSRYQQELGATAACTNRMLGATKGIGQKYRKGAMEDFFFLIVGSPQRRWQNLRCKLLTS